MCLISYSKTSLAAFWLPELPRNLFYYLRVSDDNRLWIGNFAARFPAQVSEANLNLGFETQAEIFKNVYAVLFVS